MVSVNEGMFCLFALIFFPAFVLFCLYGRLYFAFFLILILIFLFNF